MKIASIIDNVVENYLKEHTGKNIALRKIYKDLKIRRRKAIWLIHLSQNISNVKPHVVGSNASFLHVYRYDNEKFI